MFHGFYIGDGWLQVVGLDIQDVEYSKFGKEFLQKYLELPFASMSKSELELLIFSAMKDSGIIKESESSFSVSIQLDCSRNKVDSMLYAYRNRRFNDSSFANEFSSSVRVAEATAEKLILNVGDRFYRELLIDRMKLAEIFSDSSFNRERVVIPGHLFIQNIEKVFPGDTADRIHSLISEEVSDVTSVGWRGRWAKFAHKLASDSSGGIIGYSANELLDELVRHWPGN